MRTSVLAAASLCLACFTAQASTITFSGAPSGSGFTGPVTESGYTYSLYSGTLYINSDGNPGKNVEPTFGSGGVLQIVSANGGLFDFGGIDVGSEGAGSITVSGYNGSELVGTDTFAGQNTGLPGGYNTYVSSNLFGLTSLRISLPGSPETAIDNVVVNATAVTPEPSSVVLLGTGLIGFPGMIRKRWAV